jgi:hypothetical protein
MSTSSRPCMGTMRRPARTAAVTARRLDGNGSTSRPRGRPTSCMEAASPMRWCGTTGGACHPSAGDPGQDSEYGTRRCLDAGRSVRRPLTRGLRAAATKSRVHRCSRWPRPFRQPGLRFREDPRVGGCSQIRGFPDRRGDFTEVRPRSAPATLEISTLVRRASLRRRVVVPRATGGACVPVVTVCQFWTCRGRSD